MKFAPGMENAYIHPELEIKIDALQFTLIQLCHDYLDGCNSVYSIYFYRISKPKSSSIELRVPLQEAIHGFMSEVLSGPLQTKKDLMQIFTMPMLEVLQALQATIYPLTDEGMLLYDELLKPSVMSISAVAVCINDFWFILMAEWSD